VDADLDARKAQVEGFGDCVCGFFRSGDEIPDRMVRHGTGSVAACYINIFTCGNDLCTLRVFVIFLDPLGVVLLGQDAEHTQFPDGRDTVVGPGLDSILFESIIADCHVYVGINKAGQQGAAGQVDLLVRRGQVLSNSPDILVLHQYIERLVIVNCVQQQCVLQ
jgi:hypothetical protein